MKTQFFCYLLAAMLAMPAFASEARADSEPTKTENSADTTIGKKKPKKVKKAKRGKKGNRKNTYRPGARQN